MATVADSTRMMATMLVLMLFAAPLNARRRAAILVHLPVRVAPVCLRQPSNPILHVPARVEEAPTAGLAHVLKPHQLHWHDRVAATHGIKLHQDEGLDYI